MRFLTLSLTMISLCLVAATEPSEAELEARELVIEGAKLGEAGNLDGAIDRFRAAEAIFPRPIHACNIGLSFSRKKQWAPALTYLTRCKQNAKRKLPGWVAPHIRDAKRKVKRAKLIKVIIDTSASDLRVRPEGVYGDDHFTTPLTLWQSPGTWSFSYLGSDDTEYEYTLTLRATHSPHTITLAAAQSPASSAPGDLGVAADQAPSTSRFRLRLIGSLGLIGHGTYTFKLLGHELWDQEMPLAGNGGLGFDVTIGRYLSLGLSALVGVDDIEVSAPNTPPVLEDSYLSARMRAVIRARVPFAKSRGELSLSLPVGLAMYLPNDDNEQALSQAMNGVQVTLDTLLGWTIEALLGVQYALTEAVALGLELGWAYVSVSGGGDARGLNDFGEIISYPYDIDIDNHSLRMQLQLVFTL